jgi:hypothetical protein
MPDAACELSDDAVVRRNRVEGVDRRAADPMLSVNGGLTSGLERLRLR